jgi:hypothetical protein
MLGSIMHVGLGVASIVNALWLVQPLLKIVILVTMFRRKLHVRYPLFFSYLAYGVAVTALLYAVHGSYRAYFYAYWSTTAVSSMLILGVIYELFTSMFRQHHALRDFGSMLFRWAVVMVAMMAALLLFSGINPTKNSVINSIMNLDRSVGVMQSGMLLFLVLFSPYLKIPWRHQISGIALGFGVHSSIRMLLLSQWIHGVFGASNLNILSMAAYNWTLVIWLVYACMRVPEENAPNMLLRPQRWNEALLDASQPANGPVLLGIETIVERALSARAAKPAHTN